MLVGPSELLICVASELRAFPLSPERFLLLLPLQSDKWAGGVGSDLGLLP